ncbi:hypothetical protein F1B92_08495 [Campylobacter sp. FMV-PI01]|uniref:Uncharacterized protein n=1 Tax=Campylobacter portucalensis TaxID=2608384 RepID=A0A6L5WMG3_9BACT|nr:hypothetical protein [Campylobacter portucalensis]MSN97195.1 hypothetical protein [Campylobacter portucalensis]
MNLIKAFFKANNLEFKNILTILKYICMFIIIFTFLMMVYEIVSLNALYYNDPYNKFFKIFIVFCLSIIFYIFLPKQKQSLFKNIYFIIILIASLFLFFSYQIFKDYYKEPSELLAKIIDFSSSDISNLTYHIKPIVDKNIQNKEFKEIKKIFKSQGFNKFEKNGNVLNFSIQSIRIKGEKYSFKITLKETKMPYHGVKYELLDVKINQYAVILP